MRPAIGANRSAPLTPEIRDKLGPNSNAHESQGKLCSEQCFDITVSMLSMARFGKMWVSWSAYPCRGGGRPPTEHVDVALLGLQRPPSRPVTTKQRALGPVLGECAANAPDGRLAPQAMDLVGCVPACEKSVALVRAVAPQFCRVALCSRHRGAAHHADPGCRCTTTHISYLLSCRAYVGLPIAPPDLSIFWFRRCLGSSSVCGRLPSFPGHVENEP